jgi:hypothetical protein
MTAIAAQNRTAGFGVYDMGTFSGWLSGTREYACERRTRQSRQYPSSPCRQDFRLQIGEPAQAAPRAGRQRHVIHQHRVRSVRRNRGGPPAQHVGGREGLDAAKLVEQVGTQEHA